MAFNLEDYEDVDTRVHRFWEANKDVEGSGIHTQLAEILTHKDRQQFIMQAKIYVGGKLIAVGYAEETVGTSNVNRLSALENAETSAIGRALANAGYSKKATRPSRQEMQKVERSSVATDDVWQAAPAYVAEQLRQPKQNQDDSYNMGTAHNEPASLAQWSFLKTLTSEDFELLKATCVVLDMEAPQEWGTGLTKSQASKLISALKEA